MGKSNIDDRAGEPQPVDRGWPATSRALLDSGAPTAPSQMEQETQDLEDTIQTIREYNRRKHFNFSRVLPDPDGEKRFNE